MALAITPSARSDGGPLGLYETRELATAQSGDGTSFTIVEGLSEDLARELRERSLDLADTELQKTSDYERFGKGSYEEWRGIKERTLYALVAHDGALAALVWFGPKPLGRKSMKHQAEGERWQDERSLDSGAWHTVVYRSYPPYRGTGLMKDFVRFSMESYAARHEGAKFWAGIFAENPASLGLTKALGFSVAGTEGDETIMVKE